MPPTKLFLLVLCLLVSTAFAISQTNEKEIMLLIQGEKRTDRVSSSDGRWFAYVKKSNYIIPSDCLDFVSKGDYGNEIWIIDLKKMKKRRLVANYFSCQFKDRSKIILDPKNLQFSPDDNTLYFQTSAWVVTDAIRAVDVDGKNLRLLTDGNGYRIIKNGYYKGDLIVNQHRYHEGGGSYNWDWLFTPTGKQIKLYKKEED